MRILLNYNKVPVCYINNLLTFAPSRDFTEMYQFSFEPDNHYCSIRVKTNKEESGSFSFNT